MSVTPFSLVVYIVPTPTVIITDDDDMSNIFVRGTQRSLTCNIALASYSPSSPNITVQWMKDGVVLDVCSKRVNQSELQVNGNSYTSTITFSPLNNTDTGDYTCTGTISPIGSGFDVDHIHLQYKVCICIYNTNNSYCVL